MDTSGSHVDWAVALATLLLAIVALWQDRIWRWWDRPKLEVSTLTSPPVCVMMPVTNAIDGSFLGMSVYLRVMVKNIGRSSAKNVEVFAASLVRKLPDGKCEYVSAFPSMNLRWANAHDGNLPWLSPDMVRFCDVCHVFDPKRRALVGEESEILKLTDNQASLAFNVQFAPNNKGHIVGPGTYALHVLVGAENCRPVRQDIEVWLDGSWTNDQAEMLRQHVRIKLSPTP